MSPVQPVMTRSSPLTKRKVLATFKRTRSDQLRMEDIMTLGNRYMMKETSIRRFSSRFEKLRLDHRKLKNGRKEEAITSFESENFEWPALEPSIANQTERGEENRESGGEKKNSAQETEDDASDDTPVAEFGDVMAVQQRTRPNVTMSGRPTGSSKFDDYVLEFPVPQPKSVKEELAFCREQLKTRTADLRAANEKILVLEGELQSLKNQNQALRKKRGLSCRCRGGCQEHAVHGGVLATKRVKKRKRFGQLSVNGRRRALMDIRKLFKIKEEEYSTPVSKLAGFIIQQEEYVKDRKLSKLGSAICDGVVSSLNRIPTDQALYLQTYGKMGKTGYTTLRLALLPYGLVFPPYDETAQHKYSNIVPTRLEEYHDELGNVSGLGFEYRESLEIVLERLFSLLNLDSGPDERYEVQVRDGFDAFRVSWYQQFGINPESLSAQTIPLTHWSFSVLELTDLESGIIKFEENSVSSPFISVPLSFQYGKENLDNLGPLIKIKADQQKELRENPIVLQNGCSVTVKITTQGDGKVKKMVTGVGFGCTACTYSPDQYNEVEVIAAGTKLSRSFSNNMEIWNKLVNKKGKIKKVTGDYATRMGVTQEPLADVEFYEITILHLWIHGLEFVIRLASHLRCGHLKYNETADVKASCESALREIQKTMLPPRGVTDEEREVLTKDDLEGVALSFPDSGSNCGNTNTGNASRRCFLTDHLRERLIRTVPEEFQEDFRNFVVGTGVALAVVSSSAKVSPSFKDHLSSTVIDAKRAWPELIQLSESMHQLFGHSFELIERNNMHGLKKHSEENTESANKINGQVREHHTRKTTPLNCLKDMLVHGRVRSDPKVRSFRRILRCPIQACGQEGHTRRGCPLRSQFPTCSTSFQSLMDKFLI